MKPHVIKQLSLKNMILILKFISSAIYKKDSSKQKNKQLFFSDKYHYCRIRQTSE